MFTFRGIIGMHSMKEGHPTTVRLPTASVLLLGLCAITHLGRTNAAEDQKGLLATANEMFDAVWCPLPIWAKILCVIGAWSMCYRVATDLVNVSKGKNK